MVSDDELQIEWRARDIHPRIRELSESRQTELFADQALKDTAAAVIRLFRRFPDIKRINLQVAKSSSTGGVIIAGTVDRDKAFAPNQPSDPTTRVRALGLEFRMRTDHLALLPAASWEPMRKSEPQSPSASELESR
jgi:hypothetical protein